MHAVFRKLRSFGADQSGATAIEYGMIAATISIGIIAAVLLMGDSLNNMYYQGIVDFLTQAMK